MAEQETIGQAVRHYCQFDAFGISFRFHSNCELKTCNTYKYSLSILKYIFKM